MMAENEPRESELARNVAHEARSAAMRGLLHDFSNIMVGLSAVSGTAIQEVPENHQLRSDLRIIQDSALKAQEILRWISSINARFPDVLERVDLEYWLEGEVATIRALLPKGSEIVIDIPEEPLGIHIVEEDLRDVLLVAAHDSTLRRKGRLRLKWKARSVAASVELELTDEEISPTTINSASEVDAHPAANERAAFMDAFAHKHQATISRGSSGKGFSVCFLFPRAKD